ncbi:MAG TPA: dsDNA nuclease domain-containing protein [Magnetospirillaceae bacterium]|jgi:hypothetical protein
MPSVLDPSQLTRIEAVHRGFLYQHLYAVALLLNVGRQEGAQIAVELDEDIEFRRGDETVYFQVKTRREALQPHDVKETLERFAELRGSHERYERQGRANFIIVTNCSLSASLTAQSQLWPKDVAILTPDDGVTSYWPKPAVGLNEALVFCTQLATSIPFGSLSAETLVWKLASLIQHAATGARGHRFLASDIPDLFEQIVLQLHEFPEPPHPYRPQQGEPSLVTDDAVRLIIGFSGAGKTAWASQAAQHSPFDVAYFDAADFPSAAIAANLAREIVAQFLGGKAASVGGAQLMNSSGLDLLRACAVRLREGAKSVTVVLDNVHKLEASALRQLVDAAPGIKWLMLSQPWPGKSQFEATLSIKGEELGGWHSDEIAAEFSSAGAPLDGAAALRVRKLTGGLPLYVRNAGQLTASEFGGDANRFCTAILDRTHGTDTVQDIILAATFAALSLDGRDTVALLSQADVPLEASEVEALLVHLGSPSKIASAIRALKTASLLVSFPGGRLGLHDALRPLGASRLLEIDKSIVEASLTALHDALLPNVLRRKDIPRMNFFVRLLPKIGRTEVVADMATNEMFHEQGDISGMREALEEAAHDKTASALDRFWANDALALWESRDGGVPDLGRLDKMAALVEEGKLGEREQLNLVFKQLVAAGSLGDRQLIEKVSAVGRKLTNGDPTASRILRYNRALALMRMDVLGPARKALEKVIEDYLASLGVQEKQLLMAKREDILKLFPDRTKYDDVKRLADSLNAWAALVNQFDLPPALRRLHAAKLYELVGAGRSAATAAQNAADELLHYHGDAAGAREILEQHALPLIKHYHLTDMLLPARSQYAVVLAWCGDFISARRELEICHTYGGNSQRLQELANQSEIVDAIEAGTFKLERRKPPPGGIQLVINPNLIGRIVGPDDPCPCRSGRKYKRCHGQKG